MNQEQLVSAIVAEVKRVLALRGISVESGDKTVNNGSSRPVKNTPALTQDGGSSAPSPKNPAAASPGEALDLSGIAVITRKVLEGSSAGQVRVANRAVITPMAQDYARERGIVFVRDGEANSKKSGNASIFAANMTAAVAVEPPLKGGNGDIAGLFGRKGVEADLIAASSYEEAVVRCAEKVASGAAAFGVCIERTGHAGPVYANRNPRIRAVFCRSMNDVRSARRDLDANVIVLDSLSVLPSVLDEMTGKRG